MKEFEGIVIRATPFREHDAMVNVISSDGLHSFLARGVLKLESKNAPCVNLYTKARFQISYGKEGYSLRTAELLNSHEGIKDNLFALAISDFVGEISNKMLQGEDPAKLYPVLEKSLDLLSDGFDPLTVGLIYLAQVLKETGYGLEVNSCVICGQTSRIIGISYKDGGFICEDCFDPLNHLKCNSRKLKIVRYIFNVDTENFKKVSFEKNECKELINELSEFVYDNLQVSLKSNKLIQKL